MFVTWYHGHIMILEISDAVSEISRIIVTDSTVCEIDGRGALRVILGMIEQA